MADTIEFEVTGLDILQRNLAAVKDDFQSYLAAAGQESGKEILNTEGVQKYPPSTSANEPPVPYYIRGRGMETARGNNGKSEKYGSRWVVRAVGFTTTLSNNASYAQYIAGESQSRAMQRIGWRKIKEVAEEKSGLVRDIYDGWVKKIIRDKNLS